MNLHIHIYSNEFYKSNRFSKMNNEPIYMDDDDEIFDILRNGLNGSFGAIESDEEFVIEINNNSSVIIQSNDIDTNIYQTSKIINGHHKIYCLICKDQDPQHRKIGQRKDRGFRIDVNNIDDKQIRSHYQSKHDMDLRLKPSDSNYASNQLIIDIYNENLKMKPIYT